MMRRSSFVACLSLSLVFAQLLSAADTPPRQSVDEILNLYVKAVGGQEKLDQIHTREVLGKLHHDKVVYYWQRPDKVLQVLEHAKKGYDGGSGWEMSSKKHVSRLPKGNETALLMNADPLRYIHLKDLFHDLETAPGETLEGKKMDVLVSPNDRGSTKFYFDAETHLLRRIEDLGATSAYYKNVTDLEDYKDLDGVEFPFRLVHRTTEPGVGVADLRISKVKQNIEVDPQIFTRPNVGTVVLGGKR